MQFFLTRRLSCHLLYIALASVLLASGLGRTQAQDSGTKPPTSPMENLPPYMRVLIEWGQRPEFSHDGQHVYFVAKAWNEVFRIHVSSGKIEPMTLHFWHEGFQRVLCLPSGDLLLLGSDEFDAKNPDLNRHRLEMSILQKPFDKPPVSLGHFCDEGPAIDRNSTRIAWTMPGQRVIKMANVVDLDSVPKLTDIEIVIDQDALKLPNTHRLETQDFWPGTNKLLFTYYQGDTDEPFYNAEVASIDLDSKEIKFITQVPNGYNEAEGVAPDGSYILIESDRENERRRWKVDVYMQPLNSNEPAIRICEWNKFPGYRSDNPVVSPDGKLIAIQCGFMKGAGEGRGIVLMDVERWRETVKISR
ncbi:TolB family protein [Pirellulaceae bacterium SH449]